VAAAEARRDPRGPVHVERSWPNWAYVVWSGGKAGRTTTPEESATRPTDLVERDFSADRPNQLWVADLTYVATWPGLI
jgi:transposase InsO family protein